MVMDVLPSVLEEVISVTPAIWPNCRSRGVATDDAIISALPPGKPALTEMVGKSTSGRGATGSTTNAIAPARKTATVSNVVATGRWMKGADMFTPALPVVDLPVARRPVARVGLPAGPMGAQSAAPDCQKRYRLLAW